MKTELETAKTYTDFSGFQELRSMARNNDDKALHEVAKQFESIFLQMALKSMRAANSVFAKDNFMNSDSVNFYQDMYDQQLTLHLSNKNGTGLADMIVKQLSPKSDAPVVPVSTQTAANPASLPAMAADPIEEILPAPKILKNEASEPMKIPTVFRTPAEFVKSLWPEAVKIAKQINLDPKMLIAQAALETGWGKGIIRNKEGESSHNLFNIKADPTWKNDKVAVDTLEVVQGLPQKMRASFRKYQSFSESFRDYVDFLKSNPRYQQALSKASPQQFISGVAEAGYATDPKYAEKVLQIYSSDLFQQVELEHV